MVCQKMHLSLALGYLMAGILLGPLGINHFQDSTFLNMSSHIGLLLFLFTVGLEIPFHRIRALRQYIFGMGLVQVLVCASVFSGILAFFVPLTTAILVGLGLAFSSTAVVVQLMSERHELTSQMGRAALSILLFQDIAAIGIFVFLGVSAAQQVQVAANPLMLVAQSVGGFVLCLGLGFLLTKITDRALAAYRYSEFMTAFVMVSFLGLSVLTEMFHLSSELGAFVAGVAMASTHWRHQVGAEIHPFRTLLLAIFFVTMGMQVQAWPTWSQLGWCLLALAGVTGLKGLVTWLCALWFRMPKRLKLAALIGGCSEFLFMIVPMVHNTMPSVLANSLLLMSLISMMITPGLFAVTRWLSARFDKAQDGRPCVRKPLVVIAGFGHVGQTIARILENNFVPFMVVDYDEEAIARAHTMQYAAVHGDPRDIEFLKRIKIYEAKVLLVTFGHLATSAELVRMLRRKFPDLALCIQVRDYIEASRFAGLGAHVVVPESIESGMQMASVTLQRLGFAQDYAQKMVHFPDIPHFFGARKE